MKISDFEIRNADLVFANYEKKSEIELPKSEIKR